MSALRSHVLLVGLMLCVLAPAGFGTGGPDDSVWQLGPRHGRGECVVLSDGFLPPHVVWRSKLSLRDEPASADPRAVWRDAAAAPTARPLAPQPAPPARDGRDTHLRIGVLLI